MGYTGSPDLRGDRERSDRKRFLETLFLSASIFVAGRRDGRVLIECLVHFNALPDEDGEITAHWGPDGPREGVVE